MSANNDNGPFNSLVTMTLVVGFFLAFVFYGGAFVSSRLAGEELSVGMGGSVSAIIGLIDDPGDPEGAWDDEAIPGPVLYWTVTGIIGLLGLTLIGGVLRVWFFRHHGMEKRQALGVNTEAKMAKKSELVAMRVRLPIDGRYLLGRFHGSYIAAEDGAFKPTKARRMLGPVKTAGRGAVMYIGVTQSGKTTSVISAILEWSGPAILISVKDDLFPTLPERRRRGEVAVFDPTGDVAAAYAHRVRYANEQGHDVAGGLTENLEAPAGWDDRLLVTWNPMSGVETFADAQAAARKLTEARKGAGTSSEGNHDHWLKKGTQLLSGMFYVAAKEGLGMGQVVEWIGRMDAPNDEGEGTVKPMILDIIHGAETAREKAEANAAFTVLDNVWSAHPAGVASCYSTAMNFVEPWLSPVTAESATGHGINLEWLLDGRNGDRTLYLTAPPEDLHRLGGVYGGLINDMFDQCYKYNTKYGKLKRPLLIVIDEASKIPLERLAEYVSTVGGFGVQIVTIWQDKAQIEATYGKMHESILTNHVTKIIYPGLGGEDMAYFSKFIGEENVTSASETADLHNAMSGSVMQRDEKRAVAPGHTIRQMSDGTALLLHAKQAPAHIQITPFYENDRWLKMLEWNEPVGSDLGIPRANVDLKVIDVPSTERQRRTEPLEPSAPRPVLKVRRRSVPLRPAMSSDPMAGLLDSVVGKSGKKPTADDE